MVNAKSDSIDSGDKSIVTSFWQDQGILSKVHLHNLLIHSTKTSSFRDPEYLKWRLEDIAMATRQNSTRQAAQLVARAPNLLGSVFAIQFYFPLPHVTTHKLLGTIQ
jgi:hypothetical protein